MSVEARVNPNWRLKWTLMALAMLGYTGLCFYDGLVAYPAHDRRVAKSREYKVLTDEKKGLWNWRSEQSTREWVEYAKSQGWSEDDPGDPYSDKDYFAQWWQPALCIPGALAALSMVLVVSRQRLIADETGLTGTNGRKVAYDSIMSIDKARWDSKGIAMVHWSEGEQKGKIKIDDWVFLDGEKVLEEVERHTGLGEAIKS